MPRVRIEIYDEDSDEVIVSSDEPLMLNEDEIADQAYRVQRYYFNRLDEDVADWDI